MKQHRKVEEARRIPNMAHATKYYQDFFAFEDLEPTEAERIDPSGSAAMNSAAIDSTIIRLRKQLARLEEVLETMQSTGWQFIEQKSLRTIRAMEQELIWAAIRKGDEHEVRQITSEHDGILAFFNLVDPLKVKIAAVKDDLEQQDKKRLIYVEDREPLTVIPREG